jgi:ATP-binding cassette, subfamily B, bacterial
VRFRYPGTDREVFGGLDLLLRAGQSTALVGINGAGKTTLVKLLARLHDPDSGRILIDGVDLTRLRPAPAPCWTGWTSTCLLARPSPWSVRTARARPPW